MTLLIILIVIIYSLSVMIAYEAGRYDRRNESTDIDGQWWMDNNKVEGEAFNFEK